MNSIANWAKQHIAAARLLIATLHILVFFSAVYLSQLLASGGTYFSFNKAILVATLGFFTIATIGWQRRKTTNLTNRKKLKQLRFFLMGICCTLLITGFFSSRASLKYPVTDNVLAAFTSTEKKEKPDYNTYSDKQAFYKDLNAYYTTLSKKELRKEFRHQLKEFTHSSSSPVGRVAIALLIILLVSAALSLIAGLSCSLACNGQGALALLVLIGGTAGVILLTVLLVKAIKKQEKNKKQQEDKKDEKKEPKTIETNSET